MKIEIKFFTYWHCGSGSSGGSRTDALVAKDNGLPYVPAKTIKGHIRDIAEIFGDSEFINICFGSSQTKEGECYFANATIEEKIEDDLKSYLFNTISSTKIDDNGLAIDKSLREIEVVVPLKLYATIEFSNNSKKYKSKMIEAFSQVKRIGLNCNRGLGRCEIREVKND